MFEFDCEKPALGCLLTSSGVYKLEWSWVIQRGKLSFDLISSVQTNRWRVSTIFRKTVFFQILACAPRSALSVIV